MHSDCDCTRPIPAGILITALQPVTIYVSGSGISDDAVILVTLWVRSSWGIPW